jgi:cytochrome c biogenesis protein CcdA/glutaredoxin
MIALPEPFRGAARTRKCAVLLVLSLFFISSVHAGSDVTVTRAQESLDLTLYYFKSETCGHCVRAEEAIRGIVNRYPDLRLVEFELTSNETNRRIFSAVNEHFGVASPGVPTLVIGNHIFVGEDVIREDLEHIILAERTRAPAGEQYPPVDPTWLTTGSSSSFQTVTLPLVITAALVDGINPCALAVLVFLLIGMTALGHRRKALLMGLTYSSAVFLLYLLAGIGILAGIRQSGLGNAFSMAAALIAIIAGLLSLRDALRKTSAPLLKIPARAKEHLNRYISNASVPAAFVLGILVGLFELPCTGAVYFTILSLVGNTMTFTEGIAYLIVYNLVFVLPLVMVVAAVYRGLPPSEAEEWRLRNMRRLRLVSGCVLLVIGTAMLLSAL